MTLIFLENISGLETDQVKNKIKFLFNRLYYFRTFCYDFPLPLRSTSTWTAPHRPGSRSRAFASLLYPDGADGKPSGANGKPSGANGKPSGANGKPSVGTNGKPVVGSPTLAADITSAYSVEFSLITLQIFI